MTFAPIHYIKEGLERLHDLKTEHQYLGRYSIEKLCAFNDYQQKTSVFRVFAVIVLTPLPTILTLWLLDCMPLRDPRGGAKRHTTTFLRSTLSHMIMTYMFLMAGRQALGLTSKNSTYTHKKVAIIAVCVSICLEVYCIIWAIAWRFPTPFREFTGVGPWGILTVLFNYIFAKKAISRVLVRLKRYLPVVGTQLVLFYFLLLLSVGFAAVPLHVQIGMILVFPMIKLAIKRALWKYARNLDDISTDVTICMVEISGSLYQTVCMQYVQSNILAFVIMIMDFLQAAFEAKSYMSQNYISDSKNTLQTAVKIVESALFTGAVEQKMASTSRQKARVEVLTSTRRLHRTLGVLTARDIEGQAKVRPVIKEGRDLSFEIEPVYESFTDVLTRLLRPGKSWRRTIRRRRTRRYSTDDEKQTQPSTKTTKLDQRRPNSAQTTPQNKKKIPRRGSTSKTRESATTPGMKLSRETATSVYINARVIRRGNTRRLLDFSQIYADQQCVVEAAQKAHLPMAPAVTYTPNGALSFSHRQSETNRGSLPDSNDATVWTISCGSSPQSRRGSLNRTTRRSITDPQAVDINEGFITRLKVRRKSSTTHELLKRKSSRSVVPGSGTTGRRGSKAILDVLTSRTTQITIDDDDRIFGHGGIELRGTEGVAIDDIVIKRKDQARILEQTLQLLFSAEVLLFVEYIEVFMPLLYAACIGGLWHLPNAKYSVILMNMSYNVMVLEVGTSLLYAMLEALSFISLYVFIKKRYGISALYQLAFLLETYTMTLQGKLIGCFIAILNSSTLHQGIDITLRFDMDALLQTPDPYKTE